MDGSALNNLLHQTESETLDFKRDQYPFEGAENAAKSELLKDILTIANAWKSSDGHILIGVEEKAGAKAHVVGVSDHLDDAKLQQFVNEKTNKPVSFGYAVVTTENKQVGVLTVAADQARPVFLKRDFGKLRKNVVYIRRGSSTGEASPDEIAEMGAEQASVALPPSIELEFADPDRRKRFGRTMIVASTVLTDPPAPPPDPMREAMKKIEALYKVKLPLAEFRLNPNLFMRYGDFQPTPEEVRAYRQIMVLHGGVGFWVRNSGTVTAQDVSVVIRGKKVDGLSQLDEVKHPKNLQRTGLGVSLPAVTRSNVTVADYGDEWTVELAVGKLQPKSELWVSDRWYVGSHSPLEVNATAEIFADNLPEPITVPLVVKIETTERAYRPEEFEERDDD